MLKKYLSTIILGTSLLMISILSLFVGVLDLDLSRLLSGGGGMERSIFLLARLPRLLAILCTSVGMSVSGLIMQQLCMNKFVSPSTGATILDIADKVVVIAGGRVSAIGTKEEILPELLHASAGCRYTAAPTAKEDA